MTSAYPGGLDAFPTNHQNNVFEIVSADTINDLADAVTKIEAELGINPSAGEATLAARLTAIIGSGLASDAELLAAIAAHESDTTSVHGITDTSVVALGADVSAAVSAHESDTSVHGIADTTLLATDAEVTAAVSAHEADTTSVHGIADTSVVALDADVAAAVSAHESDTTSVHGIVDTAVLLTGTREMALFSGLTLGGETFSMQAASAGYLLPTGWQVATAIGLLAGQTVTNIIQFCSTAGASGTLVKLGLFSGVAAPVLLGSTADVKVAYQTTGFKVSALSTPYPVTTSGLYYLAVIAVGGTTPTALRASGTVSGQYDPIGSGVRRTWAQGSLSDLTTPATPAISSNSLWFGWN